MRKAIYDKCGGHCAYCGTKIKLKDMQSDHIHPKSRNGSNSLSNYLPSCYSCNASKGSYTVEEFRAMLLKGVFMLRRDSSKYRVLERFGIVGELKAEVVFYFEAM